MSSAVPAHAPDFKLDHVRGHSVSLSDYKGRTLAVVFGGRESASQIKAGIKTIRETLDPDDLVIIGVSDLRGAPRPARILVKGQLKKAYEEALQDSAASVAAMGKPPRTDPEKDVIMLMDWSGDVVDSFGLKDVEHTAVAVLVDGTGKVVGSASGADIGPQITALVAQGA